MRSWRTAIAGCVLFASLVAGLPSAPAEAASSQSWPPTTHSAPRLHPKLSLQLDDQASGQTFEAGIQPESGGRLVVQVDGANTDQVQAAVANVGGEVRTVADRSIIAWVPPK